MTAFYFVSDTHLRPDCPERGRRLARLVASLTARDRLYLLGDICDFWFSSRRRPGEERNCPGLTALAEFSRAGGAITVLPGNHDRWLGPFYENELGATVINQPTHDMIVHGLRLHLAHGHLLGSRAFWKGAMESAAFFHGFRLMPTPVARRLEKLLDCSNAATNQKSNQRHLVTFRRYADALAGQADMIILGHVHLRLDEAERSPRLVVLGDWREGASYLRVDARGASFQVDTENT